MIYLIGGSPKCGKTTLAKTLSKKLSKEKSTPWISTDTLQNTIKPYIHKDDFTDKFPATLQREKSNDQKYNKYSADEIIEAYRTQAKTVYPAIEMFVISEILDGNDCILEGYHIEPELVKSLKNKYPNEIKSVFLIKSDESKFVANIQKSTTPNDWIIARTKDKLTYNKIAKMIYQYGSFFETESQKYNLNSVNMDNNFEQKINLIIEDLSN